jgi:hypothetical protein
MPLKSKILCIVALLAAASGVCEAQQLLPVGINDTGQTACFTPPSAATPNIPVACTDASASGQDGATGRDATANLPKTGGGVAGFDFTNLDASGAPLAANAGSGVCVRDNVTGLIWQTQASAATDYQSAYDAAAAANSAKLCGRTDWVLPRTDDLLGLVDYGARVPALDSNYFPNTPGEFFWTSDIGAGEVAGRTWVVNFSDGFAHTVTLSARAHVRLVAGRLVATQAVPRSPVAARANLASSQATAGPGVRGVAPSDAGSGTSVDPRTGLMWDVCTLGETGTACKGSASLLDWSDALTAVAAANASNWRGYGDWRLPNIKELDSLIDRARDVPAMNTAAFPTAASGVYWSSTTYMASPAMAWAMSNRQGNVFAWDKSTLARIRLVRTTTGSPASYPLYVSGAVQSFSVLPAATASLPQINIVTDGAAPVVSEDTYVHGTMTITNADGSANYSGTLNIKGHGSSTWAMPKKPYRLKLDSKAPLFGMPKEKNWILLANYDDKSQLRDALASEMGSLVGLAWSPRSQFAELTLNGVYAGTYQLTEKVDIDTNRVNIDELAATDTTPDVITGGYLVEIDQRIDDPGDCDVPLRTILNATPFCVDSPDYAVPLVDVQFDYISGYLSDTENAMYAASFADPDSGYAAWIDVDSFINGYLVQELIKNTDGIGISSDYMYKPRGGKLFYGPLWDFDISSGNSNYGPGPAPEGWWLRTYGIWHSRLLEDPAFAANAAARWHALKPQFDALPAWLDQMAAAMGSAPDNNFAAWPILDSQVWPNGIVTGSYQGDEEALKDWLRERIAWIDANIDAGTSVPTLK